VSPDQLLRMLEATPLARTIAENEILFPWIECLHVLAITLVVGTVFFVDLRLIGLAAREDGDGDLTGELLRLTWGAFVLAAITGFLLFSTKAASYAHNPPFLAKLVLLALAGANMAVFHLITGRSRGTAEAAPAPAERIAGALSLTLWVGVVTCGRLVGFTMR
jgi:hypothetical protein